MMRPSYSISIMCMVIALVLCNGSIYCTNPWLGFTSPEFEKDSAVRRTLFDSARFYSRTDPILSKNLLQKLIRTAQGNDSSRLYDYYTIYGNACLVNGDFSEAEYYYNKALVLDRQRKDTLEQIRIYNNLGHLYLLWNKLDLSVESLHSGLRLMETLALKKTLPGNIPQFGNKSSDLVLSFFHTSIGQINMKVGNYREASVYFTEAMKYTEKSKDKIYLAAALNDLASAYRHLGEYDQALVYCQKAVIINKEIDNDYGIGLNYQIMGDIYAQTEKLDDASHMLQEGMEMLEGSNDRAAQGMTLLSMVALDIMANELDEAQKKLDLSYELVNKSGDLELLGQYYYYQYKLDSLRGQSENALASFIRYHSVIGQITNIKTNNRIAEIQTSFEMQKTEQENKLLKSENELQKMKIHKSTSVISILLVILVSVVFITILITRHNRLLTQHKIIELKQKNLNQQMNPHFVYNCLSSIQSYIFHNDIPKSLDYLSKFSKLMRKILENSQNQYMSVQDEIELLGLYLNLESLRFKGKFDYVIRVDDSIDPILLKIPALLIQPFVENSVWHGIQNKEGRGRIQVTFNLSGKSVFCTIEDNGIGREYAGKLKKSQADNHISLGTSITKDRIKLLRSLYGSKLGIRYIDLKDFNNNPSGTRVELSLPILN